MPAETPGAATTPEATVVDLDTKGGETTGLEKRPVVDTKGEAAEAVSSSLPLSLSSKYSTSPVVRAAEGEVGRGSSAVVTNTGSSAGTIRLKEKLIERERERETI